MSVDQVMIALDPVIPQATTFETTGGGPAELVENVKLVDVADVPALLAEVTA
jgi:hypothetical protein